MHQLYSCVLCHHQIVDQDNSGQDRTFVGIKDLLEVDCLQRNLVLRDFLSFAVLLKGFDGHCGTLEHLIGLLIGGVLFDV